MGKIFTLNDLMNGKINQYVEKDIGKAMADDVARNCYNVMKKYILEEVYNQYSPSHYQRTFDLLNSLNVSPVTNRNGKISIRIYIDDRKTTDESHKMWYDVPELGLQKGDNPSLSDVMEILEEGFNRYRPSTDIVNSVYEELKTTNLILKSLIGYLKTKGYNLI